ncbi:hypothetical protein BH24PSE2_BH24PSE2_12970 [soil metagenome]
MREIGNNYPPKKFVVAGVQRSGTTLITTSLDSHPEIFCAGEMFKMRPPRTGVDVLDSGYRHHVNSSLRLKLADQFARGRLVPAFLDRFYERSGFAAVGFKLMRNQTYRNRFPMVTTYILERQISVLHVIRENVLKVYLSRLLANRRRVFHATEKLTNLPRLTVPVHDLVAKLENIESEGRELRETFQSSVPYISVAYESYAADMEGEGQRLLSFLGVFRAPLRSPLVKLTPEALSEVIDNLDEVRQCLQGTAYEKWAG